MRRAAVHSSGIVVLLAACWHRPAAASETQTENPAPFTEEAAARGIDYYVPHRLGLHGTGCGVCFADLDGDGDPDLVACGAHNDLVGLWENDGTGHFINRQPGSGVPLVTAASSVIAFDYDADGDLDLYFTRIDLPNILLRNVGNFQFTNATTSSSTGDAGAGMGTSAGDFNGDGFLDLHLPNYGTADRLYRNRGDGVFEEIAASMGLADPWRGFQAVFFDLDRDGDADLYVSNDKKNPTEIIMHNRLYENVGGTLVDISAGSGADVNIYSMGVATGDFNGDGLPDFYCTNTAIEPSVLLINLGGGQFLESETAAGVESNQYNWGATFFDYNHDRRSDLYVCSIGAANNFFVQGNTWPCQNQAVPLGIGSAELSYGIATADVDLDGDVDMVVQHNNQSLDLFINQEGHLHNWTKVKVIGEYPNYWAVGATVSIRLGSIWDYREVMVGGNGFKGGNELTAHFGLEAATQIDEMAIVWPGGATRIMQNLPVNRTWHVYPPGQMGDGNADGVITLADFVEFFTCLADLDLGPTGCNGFDYDGDGVVNLPDFAGFQIAFNQ
jgi:hypothetical protein